MQGSNENWSPVRLRTMARAHRITRAKKTLTPAAIVIATLAVTGITVGAAASTVAAVAAPPMNLSPAVAPTAERAVDQDAAFYVTIASAIEKSAPATIDTAELGQQIAALSDSSSLPERSVRDLTRQVRASTTTVSTEVSAYNAQVAAQAAADAAAAAEAAAAAAAAQANTPDGAKATARSMAASSYGWGDDQFSCLESLWQKESSWNYQAYNPSGATGIPQALPGSKMASAGSDWETNATTQIAWGLGYIDAVYGTPCSAWGHSQATNWY